MFDDLIVRLEAIRDVVNDLLDELRGAGELRRSARRDVVRRRTLVEAAPDEVEELERLVSELPRPGSNGHGRHG